MTRARRLQVSRYGGMSYAEVGAILGISPQMVEVIEKRALAKLRLILAQPNRWPSPPVRVPALSTRGLRPCDIFTSQPEEPEDDHTVLEASIQGD